MTKSAALGLIRVGPRRPTLGNATDDRKGGAALLLPLWFRLGRGYRPEIDDFHDGLWLFVLRFTVERLGSGRRTHGASFRLTWGWAPR